MKAKTLLTSILGLFFFAQFSFAANPPEYAKTIKNLKDAFTGETTASAKYAAYAKQAEKDGYDKVALLFRAASKSESVHAGNHKAALEQLGESAPTVQPKYEVKSTEENLKDAVKGESYEVATMYPDFLKAAKEGNVNIAMLSFNYAYQTEKKHKVMYQNALEKLTADDESSLPSKYMVCPTCGNTYDGEAPSRCGISMTPKDRFMTIE